MKDMTNRIACCVPFCRRTFPRQIDVHETICGKHWRLARQSRRRAYGRLCREIARDPRSFWEMPAGSAARLRRVKVARLADRLWKACKAETIGVAMGIG